MLWVGLTGGIASGKSTVAEILESRGVPVVSADRLAHLVIEPGTEGARLVRAKFGDAFFDQDGRIDRKKLGEHVFSDQTGRARLDLEAIVHPEVRKKTAEERARLAAAGHKVGVYEIPLLFEKNMRDLFDVVVCVAVDPAIQIDRIMKRMSLTREAAEARVAHQKPQAEKIAGSDHVIWNNAGRAELEKAVDQVLSRLGRP